MTNPILVNLNGAILPVSEAKVSVMDRSYLYGDSLYEVARTYRGKLFALKEHLVRLWNSAKLAEIEIAQTQEELGREMQKACDAFRAQPGHSQTELYCRIVLSRGEGKIGFGLKNLLTPTLYSIIVMPIQTPNAEKQTQGISLKTSTRIRNDRRALDPAMKSGNYLNNLLAFLEAESEGYEDAILCNSEGFVTEGTTFNVFYIKRDVVVTSPLESGILPGITRELIRESSTDLGLRYREVYFPVQRIYQADEAFISSTLKEILALTCLDGRKIGSGKQGEITKKLAEAFRKKTEERTQQ